MSLGCQSTCPMLEMSTLAIEKSGSDINVPQKRRKKTDPQESKEMAWDTYRWAVCVGEFPGPKAFLSISGVANYWPK